MFNKKAFINYFIQIRDLEEEMIVLDDKILALNPEKKIVVLVEAIKRDEIRHKQLAEEIINMI